MKKATFQYQIPNSNRVVRGSVTLKDDGKTSISIFDPKSYSIANRYAAKKLAEEIVVSDFNHTSIIHLDVQNLDDKLITLLKKETEFLKKQFLELTEKYAKESFERMKIKSVQTFEQWLDSYNIKWEYYNSFGLTPSIHVDNHNKQYYKMLNEMNAVSKTINNGYDNYLARELKLADIHYETSIFKLAHRISQIELNYDNIKIVTTVDSRSPHQATNYVGANINTIITDGEKTITAWTVIAAGPIQRPHYRYLVK